MILNKNIIIVLILVLIFGMFLQMTRSQFLFNAIGKNNNNLAYAENDDVDANPVKLLKNETIIKHKILLLSDESEPESVSNVKNISMALKYMGLEYYIKDINKDKFNYDEYWLVIITDSDLTRIPELEKLTNNVYNGGNVFIAMSSEINEGLFQIYRKLGIIEIGNPNIFKGIKLTDNILIKGTGLTASEKYVENYGLTLSLDERICNIHAISLENNPVIWDCTYGKGKFMVHNGSMLNNKDNRGLIAGIISLFEDDFIYPIMNAHMVYLDDFPAPVAKGYNERIKRDYNRTIEEFYRDIWWPDIYKCAAKYKIKYTALVIETYNNLVKPPFDGINRGDKQNLVTYGRDIVSSGGEIGIHGYNHQSLALNGFIKNDIGYIPWSSISDMQSSLKEISSFIKSVFPYYDLRVYVPPSNIISPDGRTALLNAVPSIKIISSISSKEVDDDQYEQEFEKSADGILEMPRLSSGYNKEFSLWVAFNSITLMGVFSHFIHPDDVMDDERGENKSWAELYKQYDGIMSEIHSNFHWLKPMTASQGGNILSKVSDCKFDFVKTSTGMKGICNKEYNDNYFVLRSTKKVSPVENCTIIKIDNGIYLINASKSSFEINLTEGK